MKRIFFSFTLFIFMLCTLIPTAHGQEEDGQTSLLPGIASPTAASLGEYGNIPVSLFTGSPKVSIPLFELKGRTLTMPIALNYNSSGVKVEEIPGWAGLGWSLDAGGVITRTVRGLPDDSNDGYLGRAGDSTEVYLRSGSIPPDSYLEKVSNFNIDGEPDQFFFNFSGRSGKIFFARDESADPYHYQPYTRPQQDIHIEFQLTNGLITSWILTTEDGTRYIFDQSEHTTQFIGNNEKTYTSSWYLTKVESASGNDFIELTYEPDTGVSVLQRSETAFDPLPSGECTPDDRFSDFTTTTGSVYLRKIRTANHTAIFGRDSRTDGGGMRLDSVAIENTATSAPIRRYDLVHRYFNDGGSELQQRLRLDRVRQFGDAGSNSIPDWKFDYDESPALPARDSNGLDYWGFYNGMDGNLGLAPKVIYNGTTYGSNDREPSESHSLAGMLTEITYPTGGKTTLTWEGHRYGDNLVGGGIRIKRIEHYDGIDPANNKILEYKYEHGQLLVDPKWYVEHEYTFTKSDGTTKNCRYLSRTSTSYVAPGMMNGSIIMYPKVTVLRGSTGEDGMSVTTYGIPQVLNLSTASWPYVPAVVESWRGGGKIGNEKELNASGQTLTHRTYDYMSANEKSIWGIIVAKRFINAGFCCSPQWEYIYNDYMVNNGAFIPTNETLTTFNKTGTVSMTDSIRYDYGNLPDQVQVTKKTETNTDSTQRITEYIYAHEIRNDGTGVDYAPMDGLNMLTQPCSVAVKDGAGNVLNKRWTLWSDSTGFWRPESEWIWTGGDPDIPFFNFEN